MLGTGTHVVLRSSGLSGPGAVWGVGTCLWTPGLGSTEDTGSPGPASSPPAPRPARHLRPIYLKIANNTNGSLTREPAQVAAGRLDGCQAVSEQQLEQRLRRGSGRPPTGGRGSGRCLAEKMSCLRQFRWKIIL